MKLKYTPGPWIVRSAGNLNLENEDKFHIIATKDDKFILSTWGEPNLPNAMLTAAAPDMLDALIWFVKRCRAGEVRSKKTYARYVEIIESATGLSIEEVLK